MDTLTVNNYQIYLGPLGDPLSRFLGAGDYSRLCVIADDNTETLCLPRIEPLLKDYEWTAIVIPPGEQQKNIETCGSIWRQMMEARIDRRSLVIDLGGGVIGDMGGFCASTFKRGIDFVQIPTTLLSQVDASIGGKLGIDFAQVKNSIGLFRDPQAVFIDPAFLNTLPARELRSGFAEIIKHSLIADADQWRAIQKLESLKEVDWPALIGPSLGIKQGIVEQDPLERSLRKALNFGHTIGHAVEGFALGGPEPLLHGEAIAVGMICEAFLSRRLLGLPEHDLEAVSLFLLRIYGHYPLAERCFDELLQLMKNDKKNEEGKINFSLLPAPGRVKVNCTAEPSDIEDSLLYYNGLSNR